MIATKSFALTIITKLHKLRVVNKIQDVKDEKCKEEQIGEMNDNYHMDCTTRWKTTCIKDMIVNLA